MPELAQNTDQRLGGRADHGRQIIAGKLNTAVGLLPVQAQERIGYPSAERIVGHAQQLRFALTHLPGQ